MSDNPLFYVLILVAVAAIAIAYRILTNMGAERPKTVPCPNSRQRAPARAPDSPQPRSASVRAPAVAGGDPKPAPLLVGPTTSVIPKIPHDDWQESSDEVDAPSRTPAVPPTTKVVLDEDALTEEPTQRQPLILLSAKAETHPGRQRKQNEDCILEIAGEGVFVVADGMGGYRGGEIASRIAVDAIAHAFKTGEFPGVPHSSLPRRASELARAIHAANLAIRERVKHEPDLKGMGTTVLAVRFSTEKQRLYVAHVGDSRCYRLRDGRLEQITTDHTMKAFGMGGGGANLLSRAVGVAGIVPVDIVLDKPRPGDTYLLCSDGLTKMIDDGTIAHLLASTKTVDAASARLIRAANEHGGNDNVSVVVVRVDDARREGTEGDPRRLARAM